MCPAKRARLSKEELHAVTILRTAVVFAPAMRAFNWILAATKAEEDLLEIKLQLTTKARESMESDK